MNKKCPLLALAALLLAAALPKEEPGEICQDSLEGCWEEVGGNLNRGQGYTWDFRKGNLSIHNKEARSTVIFQYKLGSPCSPMIIELVGCYHGVCCLEGESLKLCLVQKQFAPPTDFTPKSGVELYLLKRKHR